MTLRPNRLCVVVLAGLSLTAGWGCSSRSSRTDNDAAKHDGQGRLAPRDDFEAGKEVPITAETHYAAGQFAESQGNLNLAMEQYKKALKLDDKHKMSLFRTGIVLVKQRKFPEAIETWNRYVQATNGDATAYANLGFAYELCGRSTDAEEAYKKGIKSSPTNAVCRVNYGLMLARKERFNEAVMQLQTVLTKAEVHYNMASVYESLGRIAQAKAEYAKALEASPQMSEAQARLDAIE